MHQLPLRPNGSRDKTAVFRHKGVYYIFHKGHDAYFAGLGKRLLQELQFVKDNNKDGLDVYRRLLDLVVHGKCPDDCRLPVPKDKEEWTTLAAKLRVPDDHGVFYNCFACGECGDGYDLSFYGTKYGLECGAMFMEYTYLVCLDECVFHVTHYYQHPYITRWPIDEVLKLTYEGEPVDDQNETKGSAEWMRIANRGSGNISYEWNHDSYFEDWTRFFMEVGYKPIKMLEHSGDASVWSVVKLGSDEESDEKQPSSGNKDEGAMHEKKAVIKVMYHYVNREAQVGRDLVAKPKKHLVRVYDVIQIGGCDALIMEHYDGDLWDLLDSLRASRGPPESIGTNLFVSKRRVQYTTSERERERERRDALSRHGH